MCSRKKNLHLLELKPSPYHGTGAFAKTFIQEGTLIGPYMGQHMTADQRKTQVQDYTYLWKINDKYYVDAKNFLHKGNPLPFVNGARTSAQRKKINCVMMNIGPCPSKEKVYYMTTKNILPGEELLIDYGSAYFKHLKDLEQYKLLQQQQKRPRVSFIPL